MDLKELQRFIKISIFLEHYCGIPNTAHNRHKINGRGPRGSEPRFTDEEMKKIRKGLRMLAADIKLQAKERK